jgi:SAM-dependent methyltransferase
MRESLAEIGRRICANADATAKPVKFYAIYDRYFSDFSNRTITLLELGVHSGESLKVWASYFPRGTIIGVDIAESGADFSGYPNIVFELGDQADPGRLKEILLSHAPAGLDIIIDDASHIGHNSAASYATLFPCLNPGGLYVIEDWGTGYFDDWPDGNHLQRFRSEAVDGQIAKRMPSHDFGMVGFVKSLVDQVAGDNVKPLHTAAPTRPDTMSFMHFYKEMVIIEKHGFPGQPGGEPAR